MSTHTLIRKSNTKTPWDVARPDGMGGLQQDLEHLLERVAEPRSLLRMKMEVALEEANVAMSPSLQTRLDKAINDWAGDEHLSLDLTDGEASLAGLHEGTSLCVDLEEAWADLEEGLREATKDLVHVMLDGSTRSFLQNFRRRTRRFNNQLRRPLRRFHRRLRRKWGDVFDLFDGIRIIAMQAAQEFQTDKRWDQENDQLVGALLRLHARACQVASEIAALCRSGHSDGAHARWRTLHEISVVSQVLRGGGSELVQRYLDHENIESAKAAIEYQNNCLALGLRPLDEDEVAEHQSVKKALISKYGREFATTYGWASDHLGKRRPTFAQLEESVALAHIRPRYRLASHNVHANPKAIWFRMGLLAGTDVALAGPSNTGFADPLSDAAYSLGMITSTLVTLGPSLDTLAGIGAMLELRRELAKKALAVQHQIEDEETRNHKRA